MGVTLPELATRLIDANVFVTLSTINPDGGPQSSVIWAKRDGDEILFSTILGRRKTLNMQRDPRVSLCFFDPANAYRYVEVRGTVSMTTEGGPELIEELSQRYDGRSFTESSPDNVRVVCRVRTTKVITH
ncbi:PPOX class F420-dependent oxidoreductase [Luedemannella helvata]|uniref:PPOX class F420-dependent oxidoreductase n=1 Tax=Luedemannella helvata TaxID=349315 RepID=A0ABN2XJF0_9ACTN